LAIVGAKFIFSRFSRIERFRAGKNLKNISNLFIFTRRKKRKISFSSSVCLCEINSQKILAIKVKHFRAKKESNLQYMTRALELLTLH